MKQTVSLVAFLRRKIILLDSRLAVTIINAGEGRMNHVPPKNIHQCQGGK